MALNLLDADDAPLAANLHAYVDGVSGGVYEFQIKIQNDDLAKYYTGVQLSYLVDGLAGWYDPATERVNVRMFTPSSSSQTGTRPTQVDWSRITPSDTLSLSDIGSVGAGSNAKIPVWVRVFVPGRTQAQTASHGLRLTAIELVA